MGKLKSAILWRFDMVIYRLFHWRWSKRLMNDPKLAYLFAEWSRGWAERSPVAAECQVEIKEAIDSYAVKMGWRLNG